MRMLFVAAAAAAMLAPATGWAQHHDHDDEHQAVHSHRGPGPHFIDAFYVENAYFERKIRPDVFFSSGDSLDRTSVEFEVEWALRPGLALVVHAPLEHLSPAGAPSATGLGDLSIGAKVALHNDRRSFILSTGVDLALPTGNERRSLGEGRWAAAPFLLAWVPFGGGRRWLAQSAAHVDVPLDGDTAHASLGTALSWTSPLGVTPMVELLADVPLEGRRSSAWTLAPGVRWEFHEAWEAGASVRLPLGGPREDDLRIGVGLIHHFALPDGH